MLSCLARCCEASQALVSLLVTLLRGQDSLSCCGRREQLESTDSREREHSAAAAEKCVVAQVVRAASAEDNEDVRWESKETEGRAESFSWEVATPERTAAWRENPNRDLNEYTVQIQDM